jgi:hypothetical protein
MKNAHEQDVASHTGRREPSIRQYFHAYVSGHHTARQDTFS